MASACAQYEPVVASLSSLKRPSLRRTAQMLERVSPKVPTLRRHRGQQVLAPHQVAQVVAEERAFQAVARDAGDLDVVHGQHHGAGARTTCASVAHSCDSCSIVQPGAAELARHRGRQHAILAQRGQCFDREACLRIDVGGLRGRNPGGNLAHRFEELREAVGRARIHLCLSPMHENER